MLQRKALLIAAPDDGEHEYLHGTLLDVERFKAFLTSPLGGAWREDEIIVLESPYKAEIQVAMLELAEADYAFVSFSGHGGHNTATNSTHVALRPGVSYDTRRLEGSCKRQTLVLDCCRDRYTPLSMETEFIAAFLIESKALLPAGAARRAFDAGVSGCIEASVVLRACRIGQSAYEEQAAGGLYSLALVEAAEALQDLSLAAVKGRPVVTADVGIIHRLATRRVKDAKGDLQNPSMEFPRTMKPLFPFSIYAGPTP